MTLSTMDSEYFLDVFRMFNCCTSCAEDSASLSRSFLSLLVWVCDLILRTVQGLTGDPIAVQISSNDVSLYQTLVEKSCHVVGCLADCRSVCALIYIALADSPGELNII